MIEQESSKPWVEHYNLLWVRGLMVTITWDANYATGGSIPILCHGCWRISTLVKLTTLYHCNTMTSPYTSDAMSHFYYQFNKADFKMPNYILLVERGWEDTCFVERSWNVTDYSEKRSRWLRIESIAICSNGRSLSFGRGNHLFIYLFIVYWHLYNNLYNDFWLWKNNFLDIGVIF